MNFGVMVGLRIDGYFKWERVVGFKLDSKSLD